MNNIVAPALIKALHKKYDAEIEVAFAECVVYLSNAAGIGEPMEIEVVRGAMCGRIYVHSKGHSGGRRKVTEYLAESLNHGLTPVV